MPIVIGKELSIIAVKTDRVKSVTAKINAEKFNQALSEIGLQDKDKIEGKVDLNDKGEYVLILNVYK